MTDSNTCSNFGIVNLHLITEKIRYSPEINDPAKTAKPWNIMSSPKDPGSFFFPYNFIKKIDRNATKVAESRRMDMYKMERNMDVRPANMVEIIRIRRKGQHKQWRPRSDCF